MRFIKLYLLATLFVSCIAPNVFAVSEDDPDLSPCDNIYKNNAFSGGPPMNELIEQVDLFSRVCRNRLDQTISPCVRIVVASN